MLYTDTDIDIDNNKYMR